MAQTKFHRTRRRNVFIAIIVVIVFGWWKLHSGNTSKVLSSSIDSKSTVAAPHVDAGLQAAINKWVNTQNHHYGISVMELNGSLRTASYHDTDSFITASTYKTFVAFMVMYDIEHGKYDFRTNTATGKNVRDCMSVMIINSDDDCGKSLGFMVGWTQIDDLIKTMGIKNTDLNNYVGKDTNPVGDKHSTAKDETTFLKLLYDGKLLSPLHTELLLSLMKQQTHRERVPAGVPDGVEVADKPGWLDYAQNDMAIVYGKSSTYVVVILSDNSSTAPLAQLSSIIYNSLNP